jgi:hypothetical protein
MKSIVIASLFASVIAFANPQAGAPAAQGTATTEAAPAKPADHAKMGHSKAKATTPETKTAECKTKVVDGKCMEEAVKQ